MVEYSRAATVAAIIPAYNESERIGATVRAAAQIPHVDMVVVVDDGSSDDTRAVALAAGAKVVTRKRNGGKAYAMQTGAAVVRAYETAHAEPVGFPSERRSLLFLDADLQDSALACAPLVDPVLSGEVDLTIATLPPQPGAGGFGFVTGLGRKVILELTGWEAKQPLSGQRCITREAFEAVLPLAKGWGVEVGMTIDALRAGYKLREVECDLHHRATGNDLRGYLHRAAQYRDVWLAAHARK